MRQPYVAGSFYPDDPKVLARELEALSPEIPGAKKETAIGAVVPHAGYLYSGRVAGEVYGRIKGRKTFVIIGPNHTGRGRSFSLSRENWLTPLGEVKIDNVLASAIMERAPMVSDDASAHDGEHSIEVQLPFIQKFFPDAGIVPICVSSKNMSELKTVAEAIAVSAKCMDVDIAVLASSDMTHYETRQSASKKDKEAIDVLLSMDAVGLAKTIDEKNISMCGWAPTVIMILAAMELGAVKARLVRYADSGEITGNTSEVVGYAGIIVS